MQTRQNYRCSMCGMKCKTIMLLKQHLKRHPEKLHVCTECGGQFSTPEQVEEHMTTHVEEAEDSKLDVSKFYSAKVKCGKCGEVVEDMMNHLENCDVELEDNPMCKKCDQRFENEVELMEHIPKCKVGPYTCNICNLVIKRMSSLRRHLKLHDPASAKYQCEVCDRSFHQRWDLVEHEYTHKPKVDCSACGRKISNVRNHMKICKKALADKRLTRCKNCDKVFASMEAKKAHMKDCKIDLHPCDICGLTYTQLGSLRLHKKKHHDREQGDFECMTCGMRFFVKFQLEEHEHVHRPKVTCENCGKLVHPTKRHLAVCRKPKLHECEYCGARVKGSSSHLKRHIDRHHPEYATKGQKKYEPYEQKRKFEHECETCGESFMYKGWLEAHQSECQGFIKPKEVVITNMKTEDKGGNPEDGLIAEEVEVAMLLPSVVAETEGEAGTETMLTDLATNTVYIIKH